MISSAALLPFLLVVVAGLAGPALAQQPVRPLPRMGGCPTGYLASAGYCVPTQRARGAIEKVGNSCPAGFLSSGNYCLSTPQGREAIQKTGSSCPAGWLSSGSYCLRSGSR